MEQLIHAVKASSAAAAALGATALALLGLLLAYQRTRAVERREQAALARDLAALSALAAAAPRSAPVTALITGANAGIGFTLAGLLARCGVRVVLACRNEARGTAAFKRIRDAVGPAADVRLLLLDVSHPASVLAAAARCRDDEALGLTGGLSFLFLNAGVMPLSRYRWEVAVQAALIGGLGHFLTTGRAHEGSAHFLGQPQDEVGYAGAPATFATNVLGHLLLVEELAPLLAAAAARSGAPLPAAGGGRKGAGAAPAPANSGGGRVVWTGSRAATAALLEWAHLAPPPAPGQPSGHQAWLAAPSPVVLGEAYGESKAATDLLNPPLDAALAARHGGAVRSVVICPGFIDTDIAPPFFKVFMPLLKIVRGVAEGFNIYQELGAHVSIAAALAPVAPAGGSSAAASDNSQLLRADRKYVLEAGELVPARRGAPRSTPADQQRMYELCRGWLNAWRAQVATDAAAPPHHRDGGGRRGRAGSNVAAASGGSGARRRARSVSKGRK